mgnify:CR=1 FL=1
MKKVRWLHVETSVKKSLMSLEDKRTKDSVKGNKSKSISPYIGKSNSRGTVLNMYTPLPPPLNTEQLDSPNITPMVDIPTVLPSHSSPSNTCAGVRFNNGSYTNNHSPLCVDQDTTRVKTQTNYETLYNQTNALFITTIVNGTCVQTECEFTCQSGCSKDKQVSNPNPLETNCYCTTDSSLQSRLKLRQ